MKKQQRKKQSTGQVRDVNNRAVFKDPVLCAQFLRDYAGISLLKDVQPEDIEDVSPKYQAYLGITFESDTVKKIRLKNTEQENMPLYMISLIEHKSDVDYNVAMQMLRYMVCIWHEYGKEMERKGEGAVAGKNFKYPPILPIVYYEGSGKWTADLHLKDRIMMSDVFGAYLPDFSYKLIRVHDYTNEELLNHENEMSLLMMINKLQTSEDIKAFWQNIQADKVNEIIKNTPDSTLDVIVSVAWSLLMKLNVPAEEAKQYVKKIKERQMGYWFENMEKMDIQEERRKTAEARKEMEKVHKEVEEQRERIEEQKGKIEEQKGNIEVQKKKIEEQKGKIEEQKGKIEEQKGKIEEQKGKIEEQRKEIETQKEKIEEQCKHAEEAEKKLREKAEHEIEIIISLCQKLNVVKESAVLQVMENSILSRKEAEDKVSFYWKD